MYVSPAERKVLIRARAKIERIQRDLGPAKGLTQEEARIAAKRWRSI